MGDADCVVLVLKWCLVDSLRNKFASSESQRLWCALPTVLCAKSPFVEVMIARDRRCWHDGVLLWPGLHYNISVFHRSVPFCSKCWLDFVPGDLALPHECRNEISHCPPGTENSEMVELCEMGPPSHIRPTNTSRHLFRNSFCMECWRSRESELVTPVHPSYDPLLNQTLVSLHPIIQYAVKSNFTFLSYSAEKHSLHKELQAHLNDDTWYTYNVTRNSPVDGRPSWDLGSIRCDSDFPEVCAHFIKFPEDENVCAGPGCGNNNVQDAFGTCLDPSEYQYSDDWRKDTNYVSPAWLLLRYDNLCHSTNPRSGRSCQWVTRATRAVHVKRGQGGFVCKMVHGINVS